MKRSIFFLLSLFVCSSVLSQEHIKTKTSSFGSTKQRTIQIEDSNNDVYLLNQFCDTSGIMMEPKIHYYNEDKSNSKEILHKHPNESDKNEYKLTLKFDIPLKHGGNFYITSEEMYASNHDFVWQTNYIASTNLVEGEYDLLLTFFNYSGNFYQDSCLYIVSIPNLILESDMDTLITIEDLVTNYVYLDFRDEFDSVISSNDTNIIESLMACNISFPSGLNLSEVGFDISSYPVDYYRTSDLNSNYFISNQRSNFSYKGLYVASFDPIHGISGDIILRNDIDKYLNTNVTYRMHPNNINNYLVLINGSMISNDYMTGYGGMWINNVDYPISDTDTIPLYLANHYIEGSQFFAATKFLINEYIDSTHVYNNLIFEYPMYRMTEPVDSIVISPGYPPYNAAYQLGDQSTYSIAYDVPITYFFSKNQPDQIYGNFNSGLFMSQANGTRELDFRHAKYKITKGDSILASGLTSEFREPFNITSIGIYQLTITNDHFYLNDSSAKLVMKNTFDSSQEDSNPPSISSFRIIDSDKRITSTLKQNEAVSVFFSATDGHDFEASTDLKPDIVLAYYKLNQSETWMPLEVMENENLQDYFPGFGYYYTLDLNSMYDSIGAEDVLVDLRIVLVDETGNESEHSWYSAFKVISTISIGEIENKPKDLSLSPNPTNAGCRISFDLATNSEVNISVWNIAGQLVSNLAKENYSAGNHELFWNGTDLSGKKVPKGVYFVSMESILGQETIQLIIQ